MKATFYKSLTVSLLITTIWTVVGFFIYFFEEPGIFHGLDTLIFFMLSCWTSAGLGLLLSIVCLLMPRIPVNLKISMLTISIVVNCFFITLFLLLAILNLVNIGSFWKLFFGANLVIAIANFTVKKKLQTRQSRAIGFVPDEPNNPQVSMPAQYKILTLTPTTDQNPDSPKKFNVTAISLSKNIEVELNGISLPAYVREGDTIRWAEHKFYDVIDDEGNFLRR